MNNPIATGDRRVKEAGAAIADAGVAFVSLDNPEEIEFRPRACSV